MDDADANDLKEQGNALFRRGDYAGASGLYTRALALDRGNAVCFHNRAVCKLRLGDAAGAVADAAEATTWKRDYAKAWSTKGSALIELRRFAEAEAAFRAGLELEPTSATLRANLAHLQQLVAGGGGGGGGSGAPPPPPPSPAPRAGAAPPAPAPPAAAAAARPPASTLLLGVPVPAGGADRAILAGRVGLALLLLVYLLAPLVRGGRASAGAYYWLLLLAAATHAGDLLRRHGLPRGVTSAAALAPWVTTVARDPVAHLVLLPLLFYPAPRPNLVAAVVCVDFDVLHALDWAHTAAAARAPALARGLEAAALWAGPALAGGGRSRDDFARLRQPERWAAVNASLLGLNALGEVLLTLASLAGLLTRSRSVMTALALVQLLQLRWMLSEHTRAACAQLDGALGKLLGHPLCPAPLGRGYAWLRRFLRSKVRTLEEAQAEAAAGAARGGGGSCAVM
jgi:hypothetical protein